MKKHRVGIGFLAAGLFLGVLVWRGLNGGARAGETFQTGKPLPDFQLKQHDGKTFSLKKALGKGPIVLAFFPAAFSPVCTKQLCDYRDHLPNLRKLKADIYGVSADSVDTLKKFHKAENFSFPLLSDPGGKLAMKFDAWYANLSKTKRAIIIIDSKGVLRYNEAESVPITFKDTKKLVELIGESGG